MTESVLLGLVQGITEFFPVSSTAHLVLFPWFFGWEGDLGSLLFDVALHAGTLLSLFVCLWRDIADMFIKRRRLLFLLIVGTVPAGLAGVFLEEYVAGALRSPQVIAASLVVFGFVMYAAEKFAGKRDLRSLGLPDALVIGVAQALALIPGVSRSGITISAGLARGMKRHEALRFSFLLSMPVIGGAAVLELRKLFIAPPGQYDLGLFAVGFVTSFLTGIIAIKVLLKYLRTHTMNAFVIYRFALAGVILGWLWLGG